MADGPEAGWYDDGHGMQRWWDGARWSEHFIDLNDRDIEVRTDPSATEGPEDSLAGITIDGRSIRFGGMTQPIAGAVASQMTGRELLRLGMLAGPSVARTLFGPAGPITPRLLKRSIDADGVYLLVEVAGAHWLAPVPGRDAVRAARFATWINNVSQHYRYR